MKTAIGQHGSDHDILVTGSGEEAELEQVREATRTGRPLVSPDFIQDVGCNYVHGIGGKPAALRKTAVDKVEVGYFMTSGMGNEYLLVFCSVFVFQGQATKLRILRTHSRLCRLTSWPSLTKQTPEKYRPIAAFHYNNGILRIG